MDTKKVLVKMVMDRWQASLDRFTALLKSISDEQLQREISPNKNRGIYVLGHLIAVHDDMMTLIDVGDKEYPHLQEIFLSSPDKIRSDLPSATELRIIWHEQMENLNQKFNSLTPDDWFDRHTAVAAIEFISEPHRNKLNIVLTRTTHLNYHTGQMILLA